MYMYDEIMQQPDVLNLCRTTNVKIISQVVTDIRKKDINNIVIAARGTSDHAAIFAKYCFEIETGLPVSLAAPSVITLYNGKMDYEKSLVVGVSQSGMAEDALCIIRAAKHQNASTIAVTNNADSPLAREAKYHLFINAGKEKSVAATKTFLSQMYVLSLLSAFLSSDNKKIENLALLPDMIQTQLLNETIIKHILEEAQRYKQVDSCFILARGLLYPVALEAALKLQETAYVHAHGYAISDFWHGPLAMVNNNTPIILYGSNDEALSDDIQIAKKLRELGGNLLIFTDNEKLASYANRIIMIPPQQSSTVFLHTIAAQLFAYSVSIAKGQNPDKPRSLKKITITK